MKKIVIIFGTRPEAIKMCPLVLECQRRGDFKTVVCVSGQHREMLDQVLKVFGVEPDYDLSIMKPNQTLFDVTVGLLEGFSKVLEVEKPDMVLVHGDTTTTFAAGLACFYKEIPVGHVEAGLRTGNIHSPFPEEFNRCAVSLFSKLDFAPTEASKANLLLEGKRPEQIYVTGNTAIDALNTTVLEDFQHDILTWLGEHKMLLITAHRRENQGEPMVNMFKAIRRVLDERPEIKAVYPMHMNPKVRKLAQEAFGDSRQVLLTDPLEVLDFHNIMARAHVVMTDSGGIQEEAPSLGIPVLVMRDTTERPEGVEAGTLKLVGTDEETIYQELSLLLDDEEEYKAMSGRSNPYGDGSASRQICDALSRYFEEKEAAEQRATTTS